MKNLIQKSVAICLLITICSCFLVGCGTENFEPFYWGDFQLGDKIPEVTENYGEILENTGVRLKFKVDYELFDPYSYISECQQMGYTYGHEYSIPGYGPRVIFQAFNKDGYEVTIRDESSFLGSYYTIEVGLSKYFREFDWSNMGMAEFLPQPASNYGVFCRCYYCYGTLYVANISRQQFDNYVQACADAGFDSRYERWVAGESDQYMSYDEDGNFLSLQYYDGDMMSIELYEKPEPTPTPEPTATPSETPAESIQNDITGSYELTCIIAEGEEVSADLLPEISFTLAEDGTGTYDNSDFEIQITWSQDGETVILIADDEGPEDPAILTIDGNVLIATDDTLEMVFQKK